MDNPIVFRTNQPAYESTFDHGSGGASLTRATQEGALFSNPSLPAFGSGFFRSVFFKSGVEIGSQTLQTGKKYINTKLKLDPEGVSNDLKTPIWVGAGASLGVMTSHISLVGVGQARAGVQFREFGSVGIPDILIFNNTLGALGIGISGSAFDTIAYGISPKFYGRSEFAKQVPLTDLANQVQLMESFKTQIRPGFGTGIDAGLLFQKRSSWLDGRLGLAVNDIGDTHFNNKNLSIWKQTLNTGIGLSLHDKSRVLHCAVDYRDVLNVYNEKWPAKTYLGCKAIFNSFFALGSGYYQGAWTYGAVFSVLFLRLELASLVVHTGKQLSISSHRIYSFRLGAEI